MKNRRTLRRTLLIAGEPIPPVAPVRGGELAGDDARATGP